MTVLVVGGWVAVKDTYGHEAQEHSEVCSRSQPLPSRSPGDLHGQEIMVKDDRAKRVIMAHHLLGANVLILKAAL